MAIIRLIVVGLFCTMFSLFILAFPAEFLERKNSLVDLTWKLSEQWRDTVKPSIYFRAKALPRPVSSENRLFTDKISITGRVGQQFVVCAQQVITVGFDHVSVVAGSHNLHTLQLAETTGELTILHWKTCADRLTRQYSYNVAQLVRSTEPFLVIRKEKPRSHHRNDDRQLSALPMAPFESKQDSFITQSGTGSGFDDHNDFKRPPFMPLPDKVMANLILLPTLNLPANWREYLPFTGLYHWLTDQPETENGLTLLVRFDGQAPITIRISKGEYPEMAEHLLNARQLLYWLARKLNGRESFIQQLIEVADRLSETGVPWDEETCYRIQQQLMIVLEQPDTEFSLEFENQWLTDSLSGLPQDLSPETEIIQLPIDKTKGRAGQLPANQGANQGEEQSSEKEQASGGQSERADSRGQESDGEDSREPGPPSGAKSVSASDANMVEDYFTIVVNGVRFHISKEQLSPLQRGRDEASSIKAYKSESPAESLPLNEVEEAVGVQEEIRLSKYNSSPLDYLLVYGTGDTQHALQSYYPVNLISEHEKRLVAAQRLTSQEQIPEENERLHANWPGAELITESMNNLSLQAEEKASPFEQQLQSLQCLLPEDELSIIFEWLSIRDQQRLSATCKMLRDHYHNNAAHLVLKPLEDRYFKYWITEAVEKATRWLQKQQAIVYEKFRLCEVPGFLIEASKKRSLYPLALLRYLSTEGKLTLHHHLYLFRERNVVWTPDWIPPLPEGTVIRSVGNTGAWPYNISPLELREFQRLWRGQKLKELGVERPAKSGALAVLTDGRLAMYRSDCSLTIWDTAINGSIGGSWDLVKSCGKDLIPPHLKYTTLLAVLPDDRLAVVRPDHTVEIWNAITKTCTTTLVGHDTSVFSLAVLPEGRLASRSAVGPIKVWDTRTGVCEVTIKCRGSRVIALAADRLASGCRDNAVRIWSSRTGACETTLKGHKGSVFLLSVLPGDRLASASRDNAVKIWDIRTGSCVATLEGHSKQLRALAVLPDARLVSADRNGIINIWNTQTSSCVRTLKIGSVSVISLTVLPDGRLAVCGDCCVKILDIEAEASEAMQTLSCKVFPISLAVLPNGCLALSQVDKPVEIWDMYHPVKKNNAGETPQSPSP